MAEERIRFGHRRYPLLVAMFGAGGVGFMAWSQRIVAPTFVFPLGTLEPQDARVAFFGVGCAALVYIAVVTYMRFVRRPEVVLAEDEVTIPVGEFGGGDVTLRRGEVVGVDDQTRRSGWRVLHVAHRGGELLVQSSQLPDDAAYERIRDKLRELTAARSADERRVG